MIEITFRKAVGVYHRCIISLGRAIMYHREQNENGTYNTRCLYCFMTIAFCLETDKELERAEAKHICPERALAELLAREKALEEQSHLN